MATLGMPVVWTDRHRLHEPGGEIWVGVRTPGTELPERAERIRTELEGHGARLVEAEPHADEVLELHDPALISYLAAAWQGWEDAGLTADPGQDRVVPYLFPHPGLLGDLEAADPAAAAARAGAYAYDTMTLVGPGTWEAARSAVDVAVTAADAVRAGGRAAYALCRPPGHHATRTAFGGSCYLNNTAAAAARLGAATDRRVAVIDIDAHHGNGTQSIFWESGDVLVGSVHVDPGAGWFPHFLGFADEAGAGVGEGSNRNLPLAPGSGDGPWVAAVAELAAWVGQEAVYLVVALGVDAAGGDPESPLGVSPEGYRAAGRALGALGIPTVFVQEGGYELGTIGQLVAETLLGFEEAGPA